MKKNKHSMKFKPHQEQKIRTERPQSSIFIGTFQFYQDRVRRTACIAMLCNLNAKFSFCFYINIRTSHLSSLYLHKLYLYQIQIWSISEYLGNYC